MTHVSKIDGKEYQVMLTHNEEGKSYDICVIMSWPTEEEYAAEECPLVQHIDFYHGDYDYNTTEDYISMHKDAQTKEMWIKYQAQEYIKLMTPGENENVELADDALQALLKLIIE